MSKLPIINYRTLAKKLRGAGFELARTGKHDVYFNSYKDLLLCLVMSVMCRKAYCA